jgi:hypothetical protein
MSYLKTHPCVDCGISDVVLLDFDHVRGKKRAGVCDLINRAARWETILTEIEKCEVVCANCHRKRTAKTQKWLSRF